MIANNYIICRKDLFLCMLLVCSNPTQSILATFFKNSTGESILFIAFTLKYCTVIWGPSSSSKLNMSVNLSPKLHACQQEMHLKDLWKVLLAELPRFSVFLCGNIGKAFSMYVRMCR